MSGVPTRYFYIWALAPDGGTYAICLIQSRPAPMRPLGFAYISLELPRNPFTGRFSSFAGYSAGF